MMLYYHFKECLSVCGKYPKKWTSFCMHGEDRMKEEHRCHQHEPREGLVERWHEQENMNKANHCLTEEECNLLQLVIFNSRKH